MRTLLITALLLTTAQVSFAESNHGGRGFWGHDREHRAEGRRHGRGMMAARSLEQFDTDGDGAVTQAEIDAFRDGRLQEFDSNGDGALSLEEYQALWLNAMRERMVDQFQHHDDDGDGSVTAEEFNANFSRMVERMDRNDDGKIDAEDRRGRGERGGRDRRRGDGEADTDGN